MLKTDNSFSQDQVRGIFNKQGLKAKTVKAFKPCTTQPKHKATISERLFKSEETVVRAMNQVWGSDITYLSVIGQSFLYLVIFLDFYSRRLVSWDPESSSQCNSPESILEKRFCQDSIIQGNILIILWIFRPYNPRCSSCPNVMTELSVWILFLRN